MKKTALLVFPLALLAACATPQQDITPSVSQTPPVLSPEKTGAVLIGPLVQITDYFLTTAGEKTVTLNGKSLNVSWRLKNTYAYDAQNRLIRQRTTVWNNSSWWEELSYQYTPDLAQRYQNSENKDLLNILLLTDKGYIKGNASPDEYIYNSDGYLISYKGNGQQDTYTVKDGNVVAKETVYNSGGVQRNSYEYDLTKPSIPSPLTFRGQQNRNLLVKQTLVSTNLASSVSQTTVFIYSYNYDQQDRPIREFVVADTEATPRSVREFVYQ
ncbi:hypothetical protein EXU85_32330 [Spirosoma sp. KCTC 42546]|uniref:hypothetical protein n=1 Tax=Spirosoma sp. KCTC 42546 TaxID=2520506 RepID=UPI001159B18A|nr:hypothetical protein [Spirosoma sp. KCTC 42546]QDK83041.1 hypothetical protein EXU85_32330 [Spirosoma sp. KCTC 42546]